MALGSFDDRTQKPAPFQAPENGLGRGPYSGYLPPGQGGGYKKNNYKDNNNILIGGSHLAIIRKIFPTLTDIDEL